MDEAMLLDSQAAMGGLNLIASDPTFPACPS
jgi:hypothetical protein